MSGWLVWFIWSLIILWVLTRIPHAIQAWNSRGRAPRQLTEKQQKLNEEVLRRKQEGDKL